ncbi:MAG TPA: aldehyde dehydrogenase family protein [Thermoanaerobaculia bacterium]
MRTLPLRIAGEEIETGAWFEVRSPDTGAVVARAAKAGPGEIDRAIASAAAAFAQTRALPSHRRAAILRETAQRLDAQREALLAAMIGEARKPRKWAEAEIARAAITLRLSAEEATRVGGEVVPVDLEPRGEGAFCVVRRFPVGLVTAITPFNFPLNLVAHKLGPAVAAGNPVIVKPSPRTPTTADLLVRALEASGWPAGGVSIVHADPDVARALWTDPRVRLVSFTGSDEVGWRIKAEAATKKVTLELGGNAAAIVCADADVEDAAAKLAVAAYAYSGQVCIKAQRLYVARPVAQRFVEAFLEAARRMVPADPGDKDTVLGPMIDAAAADRVASWVEEARGAGAKILLGPKREGARLWPVLAADVPKGTKIRDREVFGPVATLDVFDDLDAAIADANDSPYGLQASVFTHDMRTALAAFERLEVGGVIVNDSPAIRIDNFPYGGVKASGFGREGVRWAIEEMTEPRTLFLRP